MTAHAATLGASTQAQRRPGAVLRVRAAGFFRRLLAAFIDVACVVSLTSVLALVMALAMGQTLPTWKQFGPDLLVEGLLERHPIALAIGGLLLGLSALYQIYFAGLLGRTLGKRLLGLRIISVRGVAPGAIRGLFRFVALVFATVPMGLGWLWCLFDRERRGLHDHLAGTYVIADDED